MGPHSPERDTLVRMLTGEDIRRNQPLPPQKEALVSQLIMHRAPLTAAPMPPPSPPPAPPPPRNRFLEAMDKVDKTARYFMGPHASGAVSRVAGVASVLGPQADMAGALNEVAEIGPNLREGDIPGAVANVGYGALNSMGLSEVTMPLQAVLAGVGARTANLGNLDKARAATAAGADDRNVWKQTGWTTGADGQPRFEIADEGAEVNQYALDYIVDAKSRGTVRLADVLQHPELYQAYPDMADLPVGVISAREARKNPGWEGVRYSGTADQERIDVSKALLDDPEKLKSVVLHEVQHAVQVREGFNLGGSSDVIQDVKRGEGTVMIDGAPVSDDNIYRRIAGEVEARNVQTRMAMKSKDRAKLGPIKTEDIPRSFQFVRTNQITGR